MGEPPASKGSAIGLIIAGVITFCMCCNIVSPILGIIALTQAESNPKSSKVCALIGWILVGLAVVGWLIWVMLNGLSIYTDPNF